jgi:cytochrome c553
MKWILAVTLAGLASVAGAQTPKPISDSVFESRVRPVLLAKCVSCHGEASAQGGVRLDRPLSAELARKVAAAVRYDGPMKMPPDGKLPAGELAALEGWAGAGAPWPKSAPKKPALAGPHWAFVVPRRPLEPPVAARGIDAFVLGALTQKNLRPSPAADKRTLLRRVTFDLTGLPPTPEELRAFLADATPAAYANVVDRLLSSPRFGERWARHWLDVARYADSNGLDENLALGNAWRYRDWVVDALNRDLPYDSFIREQIAGDLMVSADDGTRNRRLAATGYLTLGAKVLAEQDKPKLVMDVVDEQIDVVSKSVMGLTVACARCHDHKFDPIPTRDYYALAGIFKSTKTMGNLDFVSRWNERPLTSAALTAAQKAHDESLVPLRALLETRLAQARAHLTERVAADRPRYERAAREALVIEAESFVRGTATKDTETYGKGIGVIHSGSLPTVAEWDVSLPHAGRWELALRYAAEEKRPVKLSINGREVRADAAGRVTGSWNPEGQRWETALVVELPAGASTVRIENVDGPIPHFDKLLLSPEPGLVPDIVAGGGAVPDDPRPFLTDSERGPVQAAEAALKAAEGKRPQTPMAMAVDEGVIEDVRIHVRGDTQNLGDVAPRGFPSVLCGATGASLKSRIGSGRLELARWLTRPDHPLTARVQVNRVWLHLFGEGLVSTPDNWGLRGEKPSNPVLLDWLAVTFVEDDRWSVKRLIRRLVLSDTYRQSSQSVNAAAAKLDPDNRLLWRMNRRRLDAESLRDSLLAVSGTLDETLGGTLLASKNGDYVTDDQSANAGQYSAPRRSLYLPVIRNAVFDYFQAFDFGDPTLVNAKRSATTVSPQALYLMNSALARDQARAFAVSLRGEASDPARIQAAYWRTLGRAATAAELRRGLAFLRRADTLLSSSQPDPMKRSLGVWSAYCQVLLASNEFIYVN